VARYLILRGKCEARRGKISGPYRYRLENEDDQYLDKGLIPPLKDLDIRGMFGR
jgi:hypothetical protein